jgi:hypothetical protein
MTLDPRDCTFLGPALPEPFVKFELEKHLKKKQLLPEASKALNQEWTLYHRKLSKLGSAAQDRKVANHVLAPLVEPLGYRAFERAGLVATREGQEDGGWLMTGGEVEGLGDENKPVALRCWSWPAETDLDAPSQRGRAYRYSPSRIAQRVLLAMGERIGLLTNGEELRILIGDPGRSDSHIGIRLMASEGWSRAREAPDSYRLLRALCGPAGVGAVVELTEAARLAQTGVTDQLRVQARQAIEGFVQAVIDHPENQALRTSWTDLDAVAHQLWSESLILVYRLLFTFKLETDPNPARTFSFASQSLWRHTYSPNQALAPIAREVLAGEPSGSFLEDGLRTLFGVFAHGLRSNELKIDALGGMLFGPESTPLLDELKWGEFAVATLLDKLLWTPAGRNERERVHYGALDVEDLGRVYEALLELEPGIAGEAMCRLRRNKLEVVVPAQQGAGYRDDARPGSKVEWIDTIERGHFYLRIGLGRKASGSYYTPDPFVRFLVEETLRPQIETRSPTSDPCPAQLLEIKVLDPAMGSGHFLVQACRYLGAALYEACRLCDERAAALLAKADETDEADKSRLLAEAESWWGRVRDLPDPDQTLMAYLPSRVSEGGQVRYSQPQAEAICRRMVAVHCLYGVDKNQLAVELARVALWLESYAEPLPLTFLNHRLICGDSLTGPSFENLLSWPGSAAPLEGLFVNGLRDRLTETLAATLEQVRMLEATVGKTVDELIRKQSAKAQLDAALADFGKLAAAWSGGVMLGPKAADDDGYAALAEAVASREELEPIIQSRPTLARMIERGSQQVSFELRFAEVFHRDRRTGSKAGFDAILGNPPWDKVKNEPKAFGGSFDPEILASERKSVWQPRFDKLIAENLVARATWEQLLSETLGLKSIASRLYIDASYDIESVHAAGDRDLYTLFLELATRNGAATGRCGLVLSGGLVKNPAATPWRALLLRKTWTSYIGHFHNGQRLFSDLPPIIEFSLVAFAMRFEPSNLVQFGLNLETFDDLRRRVVSVEFEACETDARLGELLIPSVDHNRNAHSTSPLGRALIEHGIECATDLHRTSAEAAFVSVESVSGASVDARDPAVANAVWSRGYAVLRNSRSIAQYDDRPVQKSTRWRTDADLLVDLGASQTQRVNERARSYRLAFRETCGSPKTNERSMMAAVLPPRHLCTHKLFVESSPGLRPSANMLKYLALLNTFRVDDLLRPKVQTSISKSLLMATPAPPQNLFAGAAGRYLAHAALRLTCNHAGYAPLWHEQLGDVWREPTPRHTWPVLADDDARWAVRAGIDAVVAQAYGLDRDQYTHVLSSFSHKSYPKAPERCLAAFDELHELGLEAFTRKHDPYHDIALVETLSKPVIDLPGAQTNEGADGITRQIEASGQVQLLGPDNGPLFGGKK